MNEDYVYTKAIATDITKKWREMGWIPPSEDPVYQRKWDNFALRHIRLVDKKGMEYEYEKKYR